MSARLLPTRFFKIDGFAIDDYESIVDGTITVMRFLQGNGGCALEEGTFVQR